MLLLYSEAEVNAIENRQSVEAEESLTRVQEKAVVEA